MEIAYQIPRAAFIWIISSVILVILPQSLRMPIWVSIIALLCIVWRILIFVGKLDFPGRSLRITIVLFTLLVSASQIRSLGIGLDSAASLLALGFVFKLIEMRYKRDIYVVESLCFVMVMLAFLYSQSVITTLYIATTIIVILGAMVALNRSTLLPDNSGTAMLALKLGLQAIPLTVVLFMVFPRIAPLWAVPLPNPTDSTGVTDEMSPGDISQLGRSGSLAFRVKFEDTAPLPHASLYWRGLVLDDFDGESWRRTRNSSSYSVASQLADFQWTWEDRIRTQGTPISYNIILEPTQQPWIFGLHLAEPLSDNLFRSRNFELFNNGLITQRLSYNLRSFEDNQTDLILLNSARNRSLELPSEGNARSLEFARSLRATVASDRDYAFAVLAYFQQNPFFYTLSPPLLGEDRVDEFLFDTRTGFCEHYASSFAFLMRAAGIPARVVIGYQGAEYNRFEDYMMIYQYNAHAWNEVWLEGEGWVRFDPTGAVSPERIELGVEEALQDDPSFLQESLLSRVTRGNFDWINTLRLRLDAIEYEWNRRVVNYDEEVQFELFQRLFGEVNDRKVLMLLFVLASIVTVAVALTVIRFESRSRRAPVNKLYRRLSAELEQIGLGREKGEGPVDYCQRVSVAQPALAELMREVTELYLELNYQENRLSAQETRQRIKLIKSACWRLQLKLLPFLRLRRDH